MIVYHSDYRDLAGLLLAAGVVALGAVAAIIYVLYLAVSALIK